jgi:hypothetical protein
MFHRLKGDHNDFKGPSHIRAYSHLRRAVRRACRAIAAAMPYRSRVERLCHAGVSVDDYAKPVADAARWPQAPLILGDKWDF